jgi:uncharacterized protein (DUF1778 family)
VALRATTIRFSPKVYEKVERAARVQEISVSEYVREAALARAVHELTGTDEEVQAMGDYARELTEHFKRS